MNILVTNIGRRGYLVEYIKANKKFDGKVFVSDCDRTASGLYGNNDGYFILSRPKDDEKKYVSELYTLCAKENITMIIPVIDPEIYILSRYADEFLEKGIRIVVSTKEVLDICYNKILMNDFLRRNGFELIATYDTFEGFEADYYSGNINFPVVVKPIYGSGSVDTSIVDNISMLKATFKEGMMIQEFIKGTEYGVDVFNNFKGETLRCVIKKKVSMRSGETDKAITVKKTSIKGCALNLAKALKHIGNLDFDILEKDEKLYIIDMNPRFGGGYPATHNAGVDLLDLLISLNNGQEVEAQFDNYVENLLVMKTIATVTTVMEVS